MMAARIRLAALTFVLVAIAAPARSVDAAPSVAEWGLRASGGSAFNGRLTHAAILPWVGFPLWEKADRWFATHDIHALWVVQPWIGYVNSVRGSDVEVGVSPLMARLTFGDSTIRPFIEGGEGVMYTSLSKEKLGTPFQFSSEFAVGLEYQIRPDMAVILAARIRHISNAGIATPNHGITIGTGLIGVTFR